MQRQKQVKMRNADMLSAYCNGVSVTVESEEECHVPVKSPCLIRAT